MGLLEIGGIAVAGLLGWLKLRLWRKEREVERLEAETAARKVARLKMIENATLKLDETRKRHAGQAPVDVKARTDFER